MTFFNQSGGEIALDWIGYDGHRTSYGTVQAGLSKSVITFVTHPWLIQDARGNCIKIVQPGPETSMALIEPADVVLGTAPPMAGRQ